MALALIGRNASAGFVRCMPIMTSNAARYSRLTLNNHIFLRGNILTTSNKISPLNTNVWNTTPKRFFGNHSIIWTAEKILSTSLVFLIPAAIISPSTVLDNLLAVAVVTHFQWGLQACVADYIRPFVFGSAVSTTAVIAVYALSALTLGGLLYFNQNDIGIGNTARRLWAIKSSDKAKNA